MIRIRVVCNILIILLAIAGCTACAAYPAVSAQMIGAPRNLLIPIQGTWQVTGELEGSSLKREITEQPWQGKELEFSAAFVLLGDVLLVNPHYKIKRVQKDDYILYGHKSLPENLAIPEQEIEIITITDADKFFCEIVMINSRELILEINQTRLYLTKVSDQTGLALNREEYTGIFPWETVPKAEPSGSGVLLGLSSPPVADGPKQTVKTKQTGKTAETASYRTLWVASQNNKLQPVLETPGIFFPRKSGFWEMEVPRVTEAGQNEDSLLAHPAVIPVNEDSTSVKGTDLAKKSKEEIATNKSSASNKSLAENSEGCTRVLRYVGNDYVSVESTGSMSGKRTLQILPIDGLPGLKAVSMQDLGIETRTQAGSFGLERRMGHWFFKGQTGNIPVIPPVKLVSYDELTVPWTAVKDKVPEAVDVVTSPNRDLALILTKRELLIFEIANGKPVNQPLRKVPLREGETLIMAEWATGRYVDIWQENFLQVTRPDIPWVQPDQSQEKLVELQGQANTAQGTEQDGTEHPVSWLAPVSASLDFCANYLNLHNLESPQFYQLSNGNVFVTLKSGKQTVELELYQPVRQGQGGIWFARKFRIYQ